MDSDEEVMLDGTASDDEAFEHGMEPENTPEGVATPITLPFEEIPLGEGWSEEEGGEEAGFLNETVLQNPEIVKRVMELNQYAYRAGLSRNDMDYLLKWSLGPKDSVASAVDPDWISRQSEVSALQSIDKVSTGLCKLLQDSSCLCALCLR